MLSGILVLDVSNFLSGPLASLFLSGLGAEVIKVERPGTGDPCRLNPPFACREKPGFDRESPEDASLIFLKRNRGKKSVTLNLQSPEGREIFKQLACFADVVLENFTPGVMDRLGLGWETLRGVNPRLIYCSISGFGQTGPCRELPAFDLVIQAMSGVMAVTGQEDGPPLRTGFLIGDQVSALFAVMGILAAVVERQSTGKGRALDISMQDSLFAMIMDDAWELLLARGLPVRTGNRLPRLVPFNAYPAKDGHVVICIANQEQWLNLLKAMGREDLREDPQFRDPASRVKNAADVEALIGGWVGGMDSGSVLHLLRQHRIPCSPVQEMGDVLKDPQLTHRKMIIDLLHPTHGKVPGICAAGLPIKCSDLDLQYKQPAPLLGEHNKEIYSRFLDYGEEELARLKKEGVI